MVLNINSSEVVKHTARLERIHKSALPSAIRNTLNDAVFDVKKRTMPEKAKVFKKRSPGNFFKANSKFEKAQGFNINSMKATVGFYENKLANASTNYAVQDLEQQEDGGVIKSKTFIAQRGARMNNKMVLPNYRVHELHGKQFIKPSSVGKGHRGNRVNVRSLKQQFIRAAIYAAEHFGKNAYVLGGRNSNGSRTLSAVNFVRTSGRFTKGKHNLEISRTPIYSIKKGRAVTVSPTNFMKRASLESGSKMESFYIKQAQRQFEKFNK